MITAIEIENFKGIGRPVRIELRPITLLFGPNSAGKSTVLHALHYAHEILSRRNFDPDRTHHGGDVVDLGGFRNFVHQHDLERSVRLRFELDLRGRELPELPLPRFEEGAAENEFEPDIVSSRSLDAYNEGLSEELESGWVDLTLQWSAARDTPIVRSYEVGVNGERVARIEASSDGANVELCAPNFYHLLFSYDGRFGEPNFAFAEEAAETSTRLEDVDRLQERARIGIRNLSRSSLPRWGELLDLVLEGEDLEFHPYPPREFRSRVSTLLVGVGQILRDELESLRYIGPMRDVLPRMYEPPRLSDPSRWASGFAAWDLLHTRGEEFTEEVSNWLRREDRLGTGYGIGMRSFKELDENSALMNVIRHGTFLDDIDDLASEVRALPTRTELQLFDAERPELTVQPSDVGVGISQILPVVVAALDEDRPGITAIEQPELHIHPKIQVELGDLFAQQVSKGTGCFLLETHSEHLMLRLLRRIGETSSDELPEGAPPLQPDEVSVVYVERVDGEVRASRLRIDGTGEFVDRWPEGFFEEREDELF